MITPMEIQPLPYIPFGYWEHLPATSAVYFAFAETGEVLYIGSTLDLRYRWERLQHHHLFDLQEAGCVSLAWAMMPGDALLLAESVMIHVFRPRLNHNVSKRRTTLSATLWEPFSLLYAQVLASVPTPQDLPMPRSPSAPVSRIFHLDGALGQKRVQRKRANPAMTSLPPVCT
jgi:hypothetical protein